MKLKSILFVIMLFVASIAQAQNLQEVVYLKNGSVVRGVIIEQIPNVSLKVQTADGSIFAYTMDEVEKITKEQAVTSSNLNGSIYKSESNTSNSGDFAYKMKCNGLPSGYRGFLDLGYSFGVGDWGEDRIEFSTSHGYQIIPYLFVGLGVGVQYYFDDELAEIPIFIHLRGSLPVHKICQPFIDWKIGYTVYDADGFYMTPSVGCRFAVNNMCGVSLSLGYTMQKFETRWGRETFGGFSIKVGFDF